ncbi:hypothetical protein BJP34_14915 [Moorena producens PAL-8-15-08-1]|uniref:Uncharacterized protein n=1 Tax=Moorena producens PAL-8-15-08-1 TaxID=1458985 RepID=A0A1D8TSK1_9CYAN|nr:hypothetical protein BJP34_14915 [Moorena producens PAL-8-15-08-1]
MNMSGVGSYLAIVTGKMPVPRQDARSTARCPFHNKMPIPQNYSNHSIIKQHPIFEDSSHRKVKFWVSEDNLLKDIVIVKVTRAYHRCLRM